MGFWNFLFLGCIFLKFSLAYFAPDGPDRYPTNDVTTTPLPLPEEPLYQFAMVFEDVISASLSVSFAPFQSALAVKIFPQCTNHWRIPHGEQCSLNATNNSIAAFKQTHQDKPLDQIKLEDFKDIFSTLCYNSNGGLTFKRLDKISNCFCDGERCRFYYPGNSKQLESLTICESYWEMLRRTLVHNNTNTTSLDLSRENITNIENTTPALSGSTVKAETFCFAVLIAVGFQIVCQSVLHGSTIITSK